VVLLNQAKVLTGKELPKLVACSCCALLFTPVLGGKRLSHGCFVQQPASHHVSLSSVSIPFWEAADLDRPCLRRQGPARPSPVHSPSAALPLCFRPTPFGQGWGGIQGSDRIHSSLLVFFKYCSIVFYAPRKNVYHKTSNLIFKEKKKYLIRRKRIIKEVLMEIRSYSCWLFPVSICFPPIVYMSTPHVTQPCGRVPSRARRPRRRPTGPAPRSHPPPSLRPLRPPRPPALNLRPQRFRPGPASGTSRHPHHPQRLHRKDSSQSKGCGLVPSGLLGWSFPPGVLVTGESKKKDVHSEQPPHFTVASHHPTHPLGKELRHPLVPPSKAVFPRDYAIRRDHQGTEADVLGSGPPRTPALRPSEAFVTKSNEPSDQARAFLDPYRFPSLADDAGGPRIQQVRPYSSWSGNS